MPARRDWYFVCEGSCGCKFFYREQTVECPRCGEQLTSRERQSPPWRRREVPRATGQAGSRTA